MKNFANFLILQELKNFAYLCTGLVAFVSAWAQTFVKLEDQITQQGEKQEMRCGEHRIILTCGHSNEIQDRQRKYFRLCNDNMLEFIANDGEAKKFSTYSKGQHKDKTPVDVFCRISTSGKNRQVVVVTDNIGEIADTFITGLSEDGTELIDERGEDLNLPGYKNFVVLPGYAAYWDEYYKSKPASSRISIKEIPPWQPKHQ